MGTQTGQSLTRLIGELEKNGPEFSVFQAIYIAERTTKRKYPERDDEKFEQTGLRFRPYENYVYPPSDIRDITYQDNEYRFIINFMGLYGVNSPLPRCYHEQVAEQQRVHGPGEVPLQNFLEIFNNRFYWLYYQAWKKYRYYLFLNEQRSNTISERVLAFIGQGPENSQDQLISKFRLMRLSGVLSTRVRNKMGLRIILEEFFPHYRFRIQEFIPRMVELSDTPTLGSQTENPVQLGQNSVVGRSMLDYLSKIRIQIGPLDYNDYLKFLPGETYAALLKELIDLYLNDALEYDVQFLIESEEIETVPWKNDKVRLGQSMWLGKPKREVVDRHYPYEKFVSAA